MGGLFLEGQVRIREIIVAGESLNKDSFSHHDQNAEHFRVLCRDYICIWGSLARIFEQRFQKLLEPRPIQEIRFDFRRRNKILQRTMDPRPAEPGMERLYVRIELVLLAG